MTKWKLITLLLLILPQVLATVQIEVSEDNATWRNVSNIDETINEAYQLNLQPATLYFFRSRNSTSIYQYFSQRTKTDGETTMASLSVTIFILLINAALFLLPVFVKFSNNKAADNMMKKIVWMGGLLFLVFNNTIIVSIAENSGLGVGSELFVYQQLFLWGLYAGMIFLFFNMIITTFQISKIERRKKHMGEE